MTLETKEANFEAGIEAHLLAHGYIQGDPHGFDPTLALFPAEVFAYLEATQSDILATLRQRAGNDDAILRQMVKQLDTEGTLSCLRKGFDGWGLKWRLVTFRPASSLNRETQHHYAANRLAVTRQVHHSLRYPSQSVDLMLSVNGIPVATAELKNQHTGQTVQHAMRQYTYDRLPSDPVLKFKRTLVHFAVDQNEVWMTTRLQKGGTFFLPFNRGRGEGIHRGRGNPDNPNGFRTAYLWETIWSKDIWLDLLARFIHLERKTKDGKLVSEKLIFPRFHQWEAVTRLLEASRRQGSGHNCLVQHSAGSGKSNTIGWLAHQLSSLHDGQDRPVFDSVLVVTDRRVLDQQLQETVFQFDHKMGVVQRIDRHSGQLGEALRAGKRIIISTQQKFPYILEEAADFPDRKYAILVDEAHSSQSGETAAKMKAVLAAKATDQVDDVDDAFDPTAEIRRHIEARGPLQNVSYFAFTATPKYKTLVLFGTPDSHGKPVPFHLYSMKQAIEEGFILDVLKHYTTYKAYYKLTKAIEDDPEVDKKKASRAIARFLKLHPHNLAQKTEVMVEHFRNFTRHKIGGKAKAMLVTGSRLEAVRYFFAFKAYLQEKGYADMGVLVAFSGKVFDPDTGESHTEPQLTGFREQELPRQFDKGPYDILLVAEKYQTGFDQPLLHTMYVDKKLDGLQAVQTLSRLNRRHRLKEDTFVLDFCNEVADIQESFAPFYTQTEIDEPPDPNHLYSLKNKLDDFLVFQQQELDGFARVFYQPAHRHKHGDMGRMQVFLDPAVDRFSALTQEQQMDFKSLAMTYVRLYGFLSQCVDWGDVELEKRYTYLRLLLTKLPKRTDDERFELDGRVVLERYRLSQTYEGRASLEGEESSPLAGPKDVGTGRPTEEEAEALSSIIERLNERFGTDFKDEDRLLFDQVVGDLRHDKELARQARANTIDQFKYAFDEKALPAFMDRMGQNEGISERFFSDPLFRDMVLTWMRDVFYRRARAER